MLDSKNKEDGQLEVSLGILTGFSIMALVNVLFYDKSWKHAFFDPRILACAAGIIVGFYFLYQRKRKKSK